MLVFGINLLHQLFPDLRQLSLEALDDHAGQLTLLGGAFGAGGAHSLREDLCEQEVLWMFTPAAKPCALWLNEDGRL